jgi:outer membrane protein TolC
VLNRAIAAGALALALSSAAAARGAERALSLEEAIALALEHSEGIVIQREALAAASAAVTGAEGAYDPLLGVEAAWHESNPPVNSAFSGAPPGRLAPTAETTEARVTLEQLLPTGGTVSVRGAADRSETDGVFGLLSPSYGTRAGVELRQPLLRDRAIDPSRFQIRVAAVDRQGAAAELRREISDTVAAVESAYWTLVAARREVGVREEAMTLASEQLSETEARIETGMAPELEISQPRAELERRRGEMLASREAAMRAENTLKLLILGDDDPAAWAGQLVPADPADAPGAPVDVQQAMSRALGSRPELAAAAAVFERRRLETALARDAVRPGLDAVVSYDRYGLAGERNAAQSPSPGLPSDVPSRLEGNLGDSFDLLADGEFDDTRVALVLSVPLGNRTARAGAEIARTAERQAAADLARRRKAVRTEVLDAAAVVETALQRIDAARAAREAAAVQLDAERDRFGAGMSTNFLVLTRQNDLSRARLDEIAAQTDYRRARTALARVTGSLLEERGISLDDETASADLQTLRGEEPK